MWILIWVIVQSNYSLRKNTNTKWRFIVNPAASGGGVAERWDKISKSLIAKNIAFDVVFTKRKMHAAILAEQAIGNGFRHLVAVGGDGTAHEVVNGLFQQKTCPPQNVTFCLLPIGTGNDWVKTHQIPKKIRSWLSCFKKEKTTFQDVGFIGFQKDGKPQSRYFINVVGLSYDGYLAKKMEGQKALFFKALIYLEMTARWLFKYKTPRLSVEFNGQKREGQLLTVNIGICKYSGGGMQLAPHAVPDDGLLALSIVHKINPIMVLLISPLFYLGKIGWHPKVHLFQTNQVIVKPLQGDTVLAEADGEFLGEAPAEIRILPKALKIVVS